MCSVAVPRGENSQTLEEPHDEPRSRRGHSGGLFGRYFGVPNGRGGSVCITYQRMVIGYGFKKEK